MCVVQGTEPARISMHAIFLNQNTHVHKDLIFSPSAYIMCTMVRVAIVASQQWRRLHSYAGAGSGGVFGV